MSERLVRKAWVGSWVSTAPSLSIPSWGNNKSPMLTPRASSGENPWFRGIWVWRLIETCKILIISEGYKTLFSPHFSDRTFPIFNRSHERANNSVLIPPHWNYKRCSPLGHRSFPFLGIFSVNWAPRAAPSGSKSRKKKKPSAVKAQLRPRGEIVISYRDHKTEVFFVPRAQPEVRKEPRFQGRAYERYFVHRETDAHSGTKR